MFVSIEQLTQHKIVLNTGAAPSKWPLYSDMADLLGTRPNATTLDYGIDGTENGEICLLH